MSCIIYFSKNSARCASSSAYVSSLVLGDVNNDSVIELILGGKNDSISNYRILKIFTYNQSEFILNESLDGSKDGSLCILDYDKNDNLLYTGGPKYIDLIPLWSEVNILPANSIDYKDGEYVEFVDHVVIVVERIN